MTNRKISSMPNKYVGNDPDPTEYLSVSLEQRKYDQSKPYDAKRTCWVPDDKEGFVIGEIKSARADMVTVQVGYKEAQFKKDLVAQVNPPKFEKCEDMSDLTYLNDASVLYNLKSRYFAKLIYTYSGLFCVAINPYKRYPIYTERVVRLFEGKRKTEVPPHIFAISDNAYRDMLSSDQNQSILITGESGAGKTENTKKVIYYFSMVGSNAPINTSASTESKLEKQIIQTNPILEAFGNAKTVRNDNSSRFGKFIRIHFNIKGKIAGADIETYLLEKARVVSQQPNERSYHIFYQIMSGGIKGLLDSISLSKNLQDYPHQSMGVTAIEGVDDKEEMQFTDSSMDILGFSAEEKMDTYKIVASVMHLGKMKFKQRGREEQAEADGEQSGNTVCKLMGMNSNELFDNLLRPKIKVGTEFVTQGRNKKQVCYSVSALCKAIFDRLFKWLVFKCNASMETQIKKHHFIGVLDIAGFEIFDFNSFEQLCINFTNEKLQQFFNHHMFVLEQEEYQREGISWTFIDFGLDLQACIDLIEKPLGIFSILEEESMFPKATNKSFEEKLINNHMGKTPNFIRPKQTGHGKGGSVVHDSDEDPNPHFAIIHYAGTVPYNVNGWLEKNKDPLNDCVVDQIRNAKNQRARELFKDHAGEQKHTKRTRGSAFQTVSAIYREQVQNLMQTLQATSPHFIRCIIPNESKDPGKIDAMLVMQQLTCNGVLEGIRICRKGFPNRMFYKDFKERYLILASKAMLAFGNDEKMAAKMCFAKIALEDDKYRLGHSKVFFRSGVLGFLEELRDAKLSEMISYLQAACRGYLGKLRIAEYIRRKKALPVVQRAIRNFIKIRPWMWYRLFKTIRPMLEMGVSEDIIHELREKLEAQRLAMNEEEIRITEVEEELEKAEKEKNKLLDEMKEQQRILDEIKAKEEELKEAARRREQAIQDALRKAEEEEEAKYEAEQAKKRAQMEVRKLKEELDDMKEALAKFGQDRDSKSQQLFALKDELERQNEQMNRLNKEKKDLYNQNNSIQEELETSEERNRHLEKLKKKMESEMDDLENSLQKEKEAKLQMEKYKRKVEEDLKKYMADIADQEEAQKSLMTLNQRKEKEMAALMAKIDDNEANCAKHQKMMRERAMRIEDLEEELEAEKKYRSQTEQHRRNLQQELDDLKLKLDEAGDHSVIQAEFNRKRESDIQSMRKDLEEAKIKQEVALAVARKKYDQALCGLRDECDNHLQSRTKLEKDKIDLENSLRGAVAQVERGRIDKANLERELKRDRSTLIEFKTKLDEANRYAFDFEQIKNRQEKDKNDLLRRLEDAENQIGQMNTQRLSLMNQLEDAKRLAAYDIKERSNIMSKYKQMEREHDNMRSHLDDEVQAKQELQRQIAQLNEQIQSWRSKYDNHTVPMIEDMENAKMKLQLRLAEAQDTIEGLNSHCINLEKSKQRVTMELEDLQAQYEVSSTKCRQLEKASNNFDKAVEEWKRKVEELQGCLNQSEKENRIYHAELASVKQYNSQLQNDNSKANFEIQRLGEEIKELLSQIGDGGRTFRELQNQKRQMVLERDELQATLQEAESALESEENKLSSSKLENEKLKSDMESRIRDKEDEFEDSKKYFLRLIASLEASFVAEQKTKGELQRLKKRLEADIRELEMALDHSNHTNNELHRNFKRTMVQNSEIQKLLEEEKNAKEEVREKLFVNERRTNSLQNELEKCKTFMEQNDRTQRQLEMEMKDIKGELHSESIRYNSLSQVKRKLEAEILSLRAELVDCNHCIKDSEMKYRQAIIDTMTLSEDLKNMVDRVNKEESLRRGLEVQLKEMVIHLEEVEASSLRGGKKLIEKLEARIKSLEKDLDTEERLRIDAIKDKRKSERKVKDYEVQLEEKERSCHRFNDMILPLHGKIRLLKQQIEEAEEIAALNLAKFKKAIGEAEDSEKRAFIAEQAITKLRAKSAVPGGLYY